MACRKAEIDKYKNDIVVLERIATYTQNIIDAEIIVENDLTNLQKYYDKTVEASKELINEFHELDKDALPAARRIKAQVDGAILTAKTLLRQAEEDEANCEIHNSIG